MEKPAVEEPTEEKMEVKEEVVEVKEEVVEVKVEVTEVKVEPEAETAGPAEPKSDRHLTEVQWGIYCTHCMSLEMTSFLRLICFDKFNHVASTLIVPGSFNLTPTFPGVY